MADSPECVRDGDCISNDCPVCLLCGALENLKLCGGCGQSYYCSREHQKSHWKQHKHVCKKTSSDSSRPKVSDAGSVDHGTVGTPIVCARAHTPSEGVCDNVTTNTTSARQPHELGSNNHKTNLADVLCHNKKCCDSECPVHNINKDCNVGLNRDDGSGELSNKSGENDKSSSASEGMTPFCYGKKEGFDNINSDTISKPCTSAGGVLTDKMVIKHTEALTRSKEKSQKVYSVNSSGTLERNFESYGLPLEHDPDWKETVRTRNANQTSWSQAVNYSSQPQSMPTVSSFAESSIVSQESRPRSQTKGKRRLKEQSRDLAFEPLIQEPIKSEDTKLADYVVRCLNDYGMCVVDNFMSAEKGELILNEVLDIDQKGIFFDGQTVSKQHELEGHTKIREDKITWVEKGDEDKQNIGMLITRLDNLMVACKSKLSPHDINGRTKAMVACYPGHGTGYKKHIDNPKGDGRCITCIYYLNKDWDVQRDGGLLRIFPVIFNQVADIEPKFDRLLFFWSDRRNPHEVQPAYRTRYAITVWYFDAEERKRARLQHKIKGIVEKSLSGEQKPESSQHE